MDWIFIIYILVFIDAFLANCLAWSGKQHWWQNNLGSFASYFPLARGWTLYYLILIIIMGIILVKAGLLVLPF